MKQKLFNVYLFLLIFNIINRGFVLLIDFRYIILIMAFIFLILGVKEYFLDKKKNDNRQILFTIIGMYIVILLSNVNLLNYKFEYIKLDFFDLLILYVYNIVNIMNIHVNSKYININNVLDYFKLSILCLAISMFGSFIFNGLPFSSYSGIIKGLEHYNMFGFKFRLSGYAVDPNYVTLISFVFVALLYFFDKNYKKNIFYYIISILLICFSFSKTIMLTLIPVACLSYVLNKIKDKKIYDKICILIIILIISLPCILLFTKFLANTDTMNTRYYLWDKAVHLFLKNPLLGNGLSSFRVNIWMEKHWLVQCHCTFLQLLAEHGIITLILYCILCFKVLKKKNNYINFTFLIYLFFAITYESIYLSFMILFFAINLYLKGEEYEKE